MYYGNSLIDICSCSLMHGSDGIVAAVIKQNVLESFEPVPNDQDGKLYFTHRFCYGHLRGILFLQLGLPSTWLLSARVRCESLGADASVLGQSPEGSAASLPDSKDDPSSPSTLLLSGKYNHDGYWPPLRTDSNLGSGRRRPATGYDERFPGVVDRLFASPIARGTTAKEIKRVKASLNRKTIVPSRPHTTSGPATAGSMGPLSGQGVVQETGLDAVANTIFSENDHRPTGSPIKLKHVEKLSYAEKLQAMIMQVQDVIDIDEK